MFLDNNETLYSELLAETKSTIDNLLVDPRGIDRLIEVKEKPDDSVISKLEKFVKDYSNSRVSLVPSFNLNDAVLDKCKAMGFKLKIKF